MILEGLESMGIMPSTRDLSSIWLWRVGIVLVLAGIIANFGTAALRLPDLIPPTPVDGASYYIGAWAMRLGKSPFVWTPEMLRYAEEEQGVNVPATPPASPPLWVWLYQALTPFQFSAAMWVWLLIQLAVAYWATHLLVRVAGGSGWKQTLVLFPFTVSFGPTFLNLTIGQNGLFVLLGALLIGRYLRKECGHAVIAVTAWLIGTAAKIYPVVWIVMLPFARKWRLGTVMLIVFAISFGAMALFYSTANHDYWFDYLMQRGREVTTEVSVDDQSLSAWLLLLGTTNKMSFRGFRTETLHEEVWQPYRDMEPETLRAIALAILLGLTALMFYLWLKADMRQYGEGLFYMLVLFTLLPLPHMERYNHVTLLPAMAWLWARGGRYRLFTVTAYCLAGLSRLNHLWALLFPWPVGPLVTATCLYSVFILGAGIAHACWPRKGAAVRSV
jgi:alpha-1,2-mannosyltransferase